MGRKSCRLSAAAASPVLALVLFVWGYGGEDGRWAAAAALVLAAGGFIAAARVARAWIEAFRGEAVRWIRPAVALAALGALTLGPSSNRFLSLSELAFLAAMAAAFGVTAALEPDARAALLAACVGVVAAFSLYGFAQAVGWFPSDFWHNGQFASRFANTAHFGALVAASLPVAAGLGLSARARGIRLAAAVSLPVNLLALLFTRSRAVWAVAACVGGVWAVTSLRRAGGRPRGRRAVWLAALAAGTLAVGLFFTAGDIAARFRAFADSGGQSAGDRLTVWREAVSMIRGHPFGVGIGCFGERCLQYKSAADRAVAQHAHNELLEVTAELGWAAVPLLGWLAFEAARRRRCPTETWDSMGISPHALAGALAVYALHSLVDFPLRLRANLLFAAVVAGALAAPPGSAETCPRRARRWVTACVVLLSGGAIAWSAALAVSECHKARAFAALARADFPAARPALRAAARWMPVDPETSMELGRIAYAASLFAPSGEKAERRREAADAFMRSARMAPFRAPAHISLGWVLADMGRAAEAEEAFGSAIRCDPTLGRYRADYGDFLLARGRLADAADQYRAALSLFRDSEDLAPRVLFGRLNQAGAARGVLQRACPDDPRCREDLRRVLEAAERRR